MNVRRVAEFVDNLECRRFLSGDSIGIDRIYNREFTFVAEFTDDPQRVVEISVDGDNARAMSDSLHEFAACNFAGRQNDRATNSGARGICSSRGRRVSG